MTASDLILGLDIGGTDTKAVVVDADGHVVHESSEPTAPEGDKSRSAVSDRLVDRVRRVRGQFAITRIGVAVPGLASRDEQSIAWLPAGKLALEGANFQSLFEWPTPVPVLNDAHAALLGEVWRGGAVGKRDVVLLTLGTGVGGAILSDGKLLRGTMGRAGHLGHIGIGSGSPPSVCNLPGALEDAIGEQTIRGRSRGRFDSTKAVVEAMQRGDAQARQIWETSLKHLAYAIASFINMLDPETIVISGGIAKAGDMLFEPLRRYVAEIEWRPTETSVPIVPAQLGASAGAIGAASRAIDFGADGLS